MLLVVRLLGMNLGLITQKDFISRLKFRNGKILGLSQFNA